jgi:hypothetical protein
MEHEELSELKPDDRVTSTVYPGEEGRVLSANSLRIVIDWEKSGVLDHQGSFARALERI